MALTKTTQMANRYGLNLKFYKYTDGTVGDELVTTIDFVNETSLELSSDIVWATGGQSHGRKIGFKNPIEGTFTISTQVNTMELLAFAADNDITKVTNSVEFKNDDEAVVPNYYTVVADTVWIGEDGASYTEEITLHKACVNPGYSVTYSGDGDPQSIDVEFGLAQDTSGKVVTMTREDKAA